MSAAANANTRKVVKRARKERLNGDLKDVDTISANIYRASGGKDGDRAIVGVSRLGVNLFRLI